MIVGMRTPKCVSIFIGFERERAEAGIFCKIRVSQQNMKLPLNASEQDNPTIRPIIRISTFGCFFIRNDKGFQGSNEILKTYYPIMGFELFKVVVYIQDNY